jgi:hypothetical protein
MLLFEDFQFNLYSIQDISMLITFRCCRDWECRAMKIQALTSCLTLAVSLHTDSTCMYLPKEGDLTSFLTQAGIFHPDFYILYSVCISMHIPKEGDSCGNLTSCLTQAVSLHTNSICIYVSLCIFRKEGDSWGNLTSCLTVDNGKQVFSTSPRYPKQVLASTDTMSRDVLYQRKAPNDNSPIWQYRNTWH